jgi:hypothetical protein
MAKEFVRSLSAAGRGRVAGALLAVSLVVFGAASAHAQPGPLTFFKNYFLTGDYVVGGVGLRGQGVNGLATGAIAIDGVPADADVVAAFLYWQVVTTTTAGPDSGSVGATFKGHPLRSAEGPFAKLLTTQGTAPCWASGGSTGSSGGSKATYTYRADVLRYLDVDTGTGKLSVNGTHLVAIPDSGSNGNATPLALGASLVVVYRQTGMPLSAIVFYDGGYTLDNSTGQMFQTLGGFYQPANPAVAKLTHIVGSGQANKSETLLFGAAGATPTPIASNPFGSSAGESWDNPTFLVNLGSAPETVTQVTTGVSPSSDCLTWGAIVFKTEVKDTDHDGLLDVWESSSAPILDPRGRALPNLKAMGADPYTRDLFIQVDYMKSDGHSHLPGHEALRLVGEAFANAPTGRINVHFDVGSQYPSGSADPYIIRGAGLARGGQAIDESVTQCTRGPLDPPWVCQFSAYPGTVGWKSGFRFLRDEVFSVTPTPAPTTPPTALEDYCDQAGYTCDQRFDRTRKDTFRYALFAHAIGLPKSEQPCLDTLGTAVPPSATTGRCDAPLRDNPDFHTPRTNTGVGDFPGADVLVTLGGFSDHDGLPIGTPFMQASTLMHELGHNLERRHGGEAFEPNCKPTYLSVMNYLYQLRGVLDDTGRPHLDYSGSTFGAFPLDETSLWDRPLNVPYRIGWYAPLAGSYLAGRAGPVLRHCDGSDVLASDAPMVRIDARTAASVIDWNANGNTTESGFPLDINFNGRLDGGSQPALVGSNDWDNIRLDQVGARRTTGGMYVVDAAGHLLVGPLSLDSGRGDLGRGDLGRGDLGRGDLGRGDLGRGDLGRGDLGRGDLGRGDLGRGDLGRGDLGRGDLGGGDLFVGNPYKEGELDAETAGDLARTPPIAFTACVIGVNCPSGTPLHAVRLGWEAPVVGGVRQYEVYRVPGDTLLPGASWTSVGTLDSAPGQLDYALVDTAQLTNGATYTYFAVARYADGVQSDPSNLVTIVAVNDPPTALADGFTTAEDTALTQAAPGVLANDGDPDSPSTLSAMLVTPPSHGALVFNADGSFSYTPAADFNGTDTFAYKAIATYGAGGPTIETNVTTVTLTVTPVNDAPVARADSFTTAEDTPLNQPAPGVLANDTDVDSAMTSVLVTGPSHGTVVLNANGSFVYTPAANYYGADAFSYRAFDGALYSAPAVVSLSVTPVNDAPVVSDITDRTIDWNTTTGAVAFTIGDPDGLTGLVVSGVSSNLTLVPAANIVFGGTGASRTVTVTPASNQFGDATVTVTVTDPGGLTASDTFLLHVRQVVYSFVNVQNAPPPANQASFKSGSAIPMKWKYANGSTVVDSSRVGHRVTVRGPLPNGPVRMISDTDPGSSSFRYDATTKTWQFNLQTKDASGQSYPLGTYEVTITPTDSGFTPSPTFQIKLVK